MSEVQKCVSALIGAITIDIKGKVLQAIGGSDAEPTAAPSASARAVKRRVRPASAKPVAAKKASGDTAAVAAKFLEHVKRHPGLRAEQVMEAIGASKDSRRLMPKIREVIGKEIKTKGRRRGMTYYVKGA
jgi:hypothetical protein